MWTNHHRASLLGSVSTTEDDLNLFAIPLRYLTLRTLLVMEYMGTLCSANIQSQKGRPSRNAWGVVVLVELYKSYMHHTSMDAAMAQAFAPWTSFQSGCFPSHPMYLDPTSLGATFLSTCWAI